MLEQMESKNTSKVKFEVPAGKAVMPPAEGRTLHDLIMFKMQTGDYVDENVDPDSISQLETQGVLDAKVIAAYKKVGVVMRSYKSGKLPKAFKIIP
jgi:essential nuclear protein 1